MKKANRDKQIILVKQAVVFSLPKCGFAYLHSTCPKIRVNQDIITDDRKSSLIEWMNCKFAM